MAAVDFRVLGPVGVTVDSEPQRLRPMEATVLAVLLADHNRPVTLDALIDRVWRGAPPRTATTAIRVHIDRLRAAMRRQEISRLVSAAGAYRLVVEPDELDAQRFDDALRRGREASGRDPRAAGVLLRRSQASPAVVQAAVDTASQQGWRRPLLAWLGVQRQWAEQGGQPDVAARIRRRMDLVEQGAAP